MRLRKATITCAYLFAVVMPTSIHARLLHVQLSGEKFRIYDSSKDYVAGPAKFSAVIDAAGATRLHSIIYPDPEAPYVFYAQDRFYQASATISIEGGGFNLSRSGVIDIGIENYSSGNDADAVWTDFYFSSPEGNVFGGLNTFFYRDPNLLGFSNDFVINGFDHGGIGVTNLGDGGINFVVQQPVQMSSSAIPESDTWVIFIGGFGLVGTAMRRKRAVARVNSRR
jgi:hypothetical protein